jgi:hypothetical protein
METGGTLDDRVRAWIIKTTKEYWDARKSAFLLSELGGRLKRELPDSANLPAGLRRFLELRPIVQIVAHPEVAEKIGVVPLDVAVPRDIKELFPVSRQPRDSATFYPEFWRAFFLPFGAKKRFVVMPSATQPRVRVADTDVIPAGETAYEILPSDLATPPIDAPASDKAKATFAKIRAWLERNGLPEEPFVLHPAEKPTRPFPTQDTRSSWSSALAHLDYSDQSRIFIPLDVVIKLLEGKK